MDRDTNLITLCAILLASSVCISGCIPIRTTNLEGSGRMAIRNVDDKADLSGRFGAVDAQTTDGRFTLYSLRREAEWDLITLEGTDRLSSEEVGLMHVLFEFDTANLTSATHFHYCAYDSYEGLCFREPEEILFGLIGELHGPEVEARQRMLEPQHAMLAAQMHAAANFGNVPLVESLIAQGASPNTHLNGMTPLHRAAQAGQTEAIGYFVNAGLPLEQRTESTSSRPLHLAAGAGQIDAIEWLLARGAAIDAEDLNRTTPLRSALLSRQTGAAMYLIEAGADVNARPGDILILATQQAHLALVEELIERGADVDSRVRFGGQPALRYAVQNGNTEIVRVLLEAGARLSVGPGRTDPLHMAIENRDIDMVQLLLEHGADPNHRVRLPGEGMVNPRERASLRGADEIDELLESYGGRV